MTTGGEALPSLSKVLPNGAVFQYPISNFKTTKGKFIEGAGVKPDIEIALDRNRLLAGTDNQLDEAIRFLQKTVSTGEKNAQRNQNQPKPPPPPPPAANVSKYAKPLIIEEYGLVGGVGLVLLYLVFLYRCVLIVTHSPKAFGALLAAGLSFSLTIQAFANMAV